MSWAHILVETLPWMAVGRALAFSILVFFLYVADSETTLGKWIGRLFIATTGANWMTAWLTFYLVARTQAEPHFSLEEWLLVLGLNIFPFLAALTGLMVAIHTIRAERELHEEAIT